MQHKINGDEVRQIDGYALLYRQITTDSNLLDVCSDVSIDTIKQMVPDADLSDSFLLTADALQAVIELMYLKGIQDGAPEQPSGKLQVTHRCRRCCKDLIKVAEVWVTKEAPTGKFSSDRCTPPYIGDDAAFLCHIPARI